MQQHLNAPLAHHFLEKKRTPFQIVVPAVGRRMNRRDQTQSVQARDQIGERGIDPLRVPAKPGHPARRALTPSTLLGSMRSTELSAVLAAKAAMIPAIPAPTTTMSTDSRSIVSAALFEKAVFCMCSP